MADTKKEQERAALHATIWRIANELRGSVDGWDFKQYVLGILFYRFISENLCTYIDEKEAAAGNANFSYAKLGDSKGERVRKSIRDIKGFFIKPSELFENVRRSSGRETNLNEKLATVFANIENSALGTSSENDLKGLFRDVDVDSIKLGVTVPDRSAKLCKILDAIGDLKIFAGGGQNYTSSSIDLFGDAYEYLMTMYAANAGKSGGEFFTPQEVSELLARITLVGKKEINKVYDPACGSGSLLLKFAKVLGKENVRNGFFGQEINLTTYNLCRINMFLHDINYEKFDIAHGDTLTKPSLTHFENEPFEAIVSNPPYSTNWEGNANPILINDERYTPAGVLAPKSKADYAFIMHILSWLATSGTAAIVCFPGTLYRKGAERKIRKYLVDNNFIEAVIQLPVDLFYGTTISTCVLVLKKNKRDNKILFIDAAKEFVREGAKNKLNEKNIKKILSCYTKRKTSTRISSLESHKNISENSYDLSVKYYVSTGELDKKIDIAPLNVNIKSSVSRQSNLRKKIDQIISNIDGEK